MFKPCAPAAIALITACNASTPADDNLLRARSDNSFVAEVSSPLEKSVSRCWAASGRFDCYSVTGGATSAHVAVRWFSPGQLPKGAVPDSTELPGYRCSWRGDGAAHESILDASGKVLTSRKRRPDERMSLSLADDEQPWRAASVKSFFEANGINPVGLHFNCRSMEDLVGQGGVSTLTSAAARRELLLPEEG